MAEQRGCRVKYRDVEEVGANLATAHLLNDVPYRPIHSRRAANAPLVHQERNIDVAIQAVSPYRSATKEVGESHLGKTLPAPSRYLVLHGGPSGSRRRSILRTDHPSVNCLETRTLSRPWPRDGRSVHSRNGSPPPRQRCYSRSTGSARRRCNPREGDDGRACREAAGSRP